MNEKNPSVCVATTYEADSTPALSILVSAGKSDITELSVEEASRLHELLGMALKKVKSEAGRPSMLERYFDEWADRNIAIVMNVSFTRRDWQTQFRRHPELSGIKPDEFKSMLACWAARQTVTVRSFKSSGDTWFKLSLLRKGGEL